MKFVDTFLFSEAYEKEILLLKLILEDSLIDEWVLVESDVTFRGDYKGLAARQLVEEDARFAPFRSRLTIIEQVGRLADGPAGYGTFYENEELSRELAGKHVMAKYPDDTWVFISDVDEMLDATDSLRRETFLNKLQDPLATYYCSHNRFWYDFDNYCSWKGVRTPVLSVKAVRTGHSNFRCRSRGVCWRKDIESDPVALFFEYTFCFPAEAMWRKLNSFIHDGYTREELGEALRLNTWVKSGARGERIGERGKEDWFERVRLTPENSPQYVRDNLGQFRIGAVSGDYQMHRDSRRG